MSDDYIPFRKGPVAGLIGHRGRAFARDRRRQLSGSTYAVSDPWHPFAFLLAFLMHLGYPELIVLTIVFLLIFGPKKIPEISKALGESIRGFKKSVGSGDEEKEDEKK